MSARSEQELLLLTIHNSYKLTSLSDRLATAMLLPAITKLIA
jgi:hypothetical protein